RRVGETEIYFVANRNKRPETVECVFRVTDKVAELWDPVTGERRVASEYYPEEKVTRVPFLLNPCGSIFVVFRESVSALRSHTADPAVRTAGTAVKPTNGPESSPPRTACVPAGAVVPPSAPPLPLPLANYPVFEPLQTLPGPWTVSFDPKWGGPTEPVRFDSLVSWAARPEPGIKYYSGTATYRAEFELKDGDTAGSLWLDLGNLRELAEVRLNGQPLGILWMPPFRVEVTRATKPGANRLEVEVVNFWPNRLIGDASLPAEQRLTRTNIRKLTADTPLLESGLLGPVQLLREKTVPTTATLESTSPNVALARRIQRKKTE
ncbi:MAG TPA: glycosyl hydrolase, partial [Candidatus Sumerlaeota bacterium]|nr:glycosyl hydrolase [Candidatus Sumerlaeota bacterium]